MKKEKKLHIQTCAPHCYILVSSKLFRILSFSRILLGLESTGLVLKTVDWKKERERERGRERKRHSNRLNNNSFFLKVRSQSKKI